MPFVGHFSRAGTLVHEATHFSDVLGTDDYTFEYDDAHELAATPEWAVNNANNYKFFSENVNNRN